MKAYEKTNNEEMLKIRRLTKFTDDQKKDLIGKTDSRKFEN